MEGETMEKALMDRIWTQMRYKKIMAELGIDIIGHSPQDNLA